MYQLTDNEGWQGPLSVGDGDVREFIEGLGEDIAGIAVRLRDMGIHEWDGLSCPVHQALRIQFGNRGSQSVVGTTICRGADGGGFFLPEAVVKFIRFVDRHGMDAILKEPDQVTPCE